jgi:hypothetical protein
MDENGDHHAEHNKSNLRKNKIYFCSSVESRMIMLMIIMNVLLFVGVSAGWVERKQRILMGEEDWITSHTHTNI